MKTKEEMEKEIKELEDKCKLLQRIKTGLSTFRIAFEDFDEYFDKEDMKKNVEKSSTFQSLISDIINDRNIDDIKKRVIDEIKNFNFNNYKNKETINRLLIKKIENIK